jgi:hypothetical protein
MDRLCSTHREKQNIYSVLLEKPEGNRPLGERIILRWTLEK